ncbi:MAG: hypothetical protein ACM3H7_00340 [Acidobacteriaceae bacterium]
MSLTEGIPDCQQNASDGIGLMLLTGRLSTIAIWEQKKGYCFDIALGAAVAPGYMTALLAGLVSFLSP